MDNTIMHLPSTENIDPAIFEDEKTLNNIRNILINSANNVVNNTTLSKYITPQQIKENIEKHTKNIEATNTNAENPIYKRESIGLSYHFFTEPVRNSLSQNSDIDNYPDMIKLLEIVGLATAMSDTREDLGYYIGTCETRNIFLKLLIANYFATDYDKKEKKEINFGIRKFFSYGISNYLELNMIYALSYIIGEETLAKALISTKPEEILINKINEITNKKNLGKEFMDNLHEINIESRRLLREKTQYYRSQTFYQEKMNPLIKELAKQNKKMQIFITTFLERNNYDIKDYNFHHSPINVDFTFNEEDINFIEEYIARFEQHCDDYRKEPTNLIGFFYVTTPEVQPQANGWDESDFTFINKVMTEINIDNHFFNFIICRHLDYSVADMANLFAEHLIPYTLKNKSLNISETQLEEMLSFLTYQNSQISNSKKGQRKLQKIKKKINQKQKENL